MTISTLSALPAPPADLKQIAPYVQRAEELVQKDSAMAYWCLYYAAQIGIGVKSNQKEARQYLLTMVTVLEEMKESNKDHESFRDDTVAAAYIENFALQVFRAADNEDRNARATRSTAKRFLAAANFLECGRIFETELGSESEEKIKYAKWKAADIAKAYREGRKPTPGPAGGSSASPVLTPPADNNATSFATPYSVTSTLPSDLNSVGSYSPPRAVAPAPSPPTRPPELPLTPPRSTSSPTSLTPVPIRKQKHARSHSAGSSGSGSSPPRSGGGLRTPSGSPPRLDLPSRDPDGISPGAWSTRATPGLDDDAMQQRQLYDIHSLNEDTPVRHERPPAARVSGEMEGRTSTDEERDDPEDDRWSTAGNIAFSRQNSLNTPDLEFKVTPPAPPSLNSVLGGPKKVHWTPSVTGGSTDGSPPVSPSPTEHNNQTSFPFRGGRLPTVDEVEPSQHPLPSSASSVSTGSSSVRNSPPIPSSGPSSYSLPTVPPFTSSPPPTNPSPPSAPHRTLPSTPHVRPTDLYHRSSPPRGGGVLPYPGGSDSSPPRRFPPTLPPPPQSVTAPVVPPPPQQQPLTAAVVAQAQKHCRFAISALEFEDPEHAIKELRAALQLLGG